MELLAIVAETEILIAWTQIKINDKRDDPAADVNEFGT